MKNKQTLIMACCGAANVGQLSNKLARELVANGDVSAFCLAGIGAHHRGFVKAATENDTVLIDGCSIGCGKLIFESAEVPLKKYLILTELGIEKAVGGGGPASGFGVGQKSGSGSLRFAPAVAPNL